MRKTENSPPPDAAALTIKEFLSYSRLSRSTVYRLMEQGTLPVGRVGRKRLIRRVDADAFLARAAAA